MISDKMSRNRKQNSTEDLSLSDGKMGETKQKATPFKPTFFVPVHPVLMLGKGASNCKRKFTSTILVICYGMYLTFSSAICPLSCLPSALPVASFASNLGTSNPTGKISFLCLLSMLAVR